MRYFWNFLWLTILLSFFSCKSKDKYEDLINRLSIVSSNGLPSPYFGYRLYFKIDDGSILETDGNFLYKFFTDNEPNSNFKTFLKDLLNGKEMLHAEDVKKYSGANYLLSISKIDKSIEDNSVDEIKKKYLKKEGDSYILASDKLSSNQIKTILYKIFVNDSYIITLNDFAGYYNIKYFSNNKATE